MADNKPKKRIGHVTFVKPELSRSWLVLVCVASFMVNFIVDGILFSFGVFLLELLDYFGESKSKTSLVGSILLGSSMMVGPVVSFLLEYFSCRQVVITGSLLSSVAFIIASFSPNIETLIIFYGVLGGATIGLMYLTSIVVVGLYFKEKRALATGIAISGSGFGTFAFSYLVDYLSQYYSWGGCVLILAGLLFQCTVCGMIFRPLVKHKSDTFVISAMLSSLWKRVGNICPKKPKRTSNDRTDGNYRSDHLMSPIVSCDTGNDVQPAVTSAISRLKRDDLLCDRRLTQSHDNINSRYELGRRLCSSEDNVNNENPEAIEAKMIDGYLHPLHRKDIFYSGSIMNLPEFQKSRDMDQFLSKMVDSVTDSGSLQSNINNAACVKQSCFRNMQLFKDRQFVLLLISMSLWTGHATVITYLPDLAVSRGISRTNATLLISFTGITNIIGRIVAGWLASITSVHSVVVYASSLLMAGCISAAIPLSESFALFAVLSLGFGFCMGSYISLRTIVIVDILGIDKLTQSFGIIAMVQGLCFALSAPISGAVYDQTHSFDLPFFMVATLYVLSGVASLVVMYFHQQDRKTRSLLNGNELHIPTVNNSDS